MGDWVYALECIAVPCLVGALVFTVFDLWDRRRRRVVPDEGLPVVDYLL